MFLPPASAPSLDPLTCLEVCAGADGQALGLEQAGFEHTALVELDEDAVRTLRINRPHWNVQRGDVRSLAAGKLPQPGPVPQLALLAAGVPCPPFSLAGQQLGAADERDLFPSVLALAAQRSPAAVLIENVKGDSASQFDGYRAGVMQQPMTSATAPTESSCAPATTGCLTTATASGTRRHATSGICPVPVAAADNRSGDRPNRGQRPLLLHGLPRLGACARIGRLRCSHRTDSLRRITQTRRRRPGPIPGSPGLGGSGGERIERR
ncbi:DNA cytosine methyltransferase [Streptomyces sp. NPDC058439]|uniref:DNA cytosine methyltransferase n=1 Tax=Streptomyces sp. NPDC058439 TaxID=3346500 RepID=UPI00364C90BC